MGRRGEPVPPDDVVQPFGMAVGQPVFRGQFGEGAGFRGARRQHVGELAEVALEAAGNDDFDDPAGDVTGVPHGVHLPARFDDVAAWPENDLAVVRPEPDLAFEHDGVLVLPAVHVWSGDRADIERMLHNGYHTARVPAIQLEGRAEAWYVDLLSHARWHDRERRHAWNVHNAPSPTATMSPRLRARG